MSFTRESVKPILYNGATIPSGTPFFMNMWAANHDPSHFLYPHNFVPERFIDLKEEGGGTQHFAYGAGTRMCAGVHLANRELYAVFTRLILAWRFLPTRDESMTPVLDSIECNAVPTSFVTQPRPFKVRMVPRDEGRLREWIEESLERTKGLK
jgi:phenylacetate 2-hydroxylase